MYLDGEHAHADDTTDVAWHIGGGDAEAVGVHQEVRTVTFKLVKLVVKRLVVCVTRRPAVARAVDDLKHLPLAVQALADDTNDESTSAIIYASLKLSTPTFRSMYSV